MLGNNEYSMQDLFMQLGLDSSETAINQFIAENQLAKGESLIDADIWNDKQRMFLQEEWKRDAVWVEVIDELNAQLHIDSEK